MGQYPFKKRQKTFLKTTIRKMGAEHKFFEKASQYVLCSRNKINTFVVHEDIKMGQKNTAFSKQELQEYAELTYLSEKDVLRAYNGYYKIDPDKVGKGRISARIPSQRIRTNTHALRLNPFGDRICQIFSTSEAGMSFEDYLDMYR